IVPLAGADEVLQRASFLASLSGDGLGGLALQAGEFTPQDGPNMVTLLRTGEQREIALDETGQLFAAGHKSVGGDVGLVQESLGVRVFQDGGHEDTPSGLPEG